MCAKLTVSKKIQEISFNPCIYSFRESHASAILHRIELHLDGIIHQGPSEPAHASWPVAGFGLVRLCPARLVNGMAISGRDPGITSSGTACNLCGGLTAPSPVTLHFTPTGTFP